jgi:uncharacterized membrane protein YdbT with pleckstrin-like domain
MSYIAKRLPPGETIVRKGYFHWTQKAAPWLSLLFLGWLIIGIFLWIAELFRLGTTEFVVTNRRILLKRGLFNVKVDEMNLGSIEGGHIDQNFIGRIFGLGKLTISGRGEMSIPFPTMAHPSAFRAAIETARMELEHEPVMVAPVTAPVPAKKIREKGRKSVLQARRA